MSEIAMIDKSKTAISDEDTKRLADILFTFEAKRSATCGLLRDYDRPSAVALRVSI